MEAESNLCVACAQALAIDDRLNGGSVKSTSDGTATLDIGSFKFDVQASRLYNFSGEHADAETIKDHTQWFETSRDCAGRTYLRRQSYSGRDIERVVVPPALPELSASVSGNCRFCKKLESLLRCKYSDCDWWESANATIRIIVHYEWSEFRVIHDGTTFNVSREELGIPRWGQGLETSPWEKSQHLEHLAVYVRHPGLDDSRPDQYTFEIGSWPGSLSPIQFHEIHS